MAAALGVAVGAIGVATADYLTLKRQATTLASMQHRVDEQRAPHRDLPEAHRRRAQEDRDLEGAARAHGRAVRPGGGLAAPRRSGGRYRGVTGSVRPDPEGEQPVIWQEVEALAASVLEEGPRVRALERTVSSAGRMIAAMPSRWPVRGAVNSEFGRRKSPWGEAIEHHSGLDIAANMGTPVKAPATATVVFAGSGASTGSPSSWTTATR